MCASGGNRYQTVLHSLCHLVVIGKTKTTFIIWLWHLLLRSTISRSICAQEFGDCFVCGPCSNAWLKLTNDGHMERSVHDCEDAFDDIYGLPLKWRLNIPLCSDASAPPPCPGCGQPQDVYGDHALCCVKMGRYKRYNRVRDFF